ncbi:hypothetical protein K469DRAFT_10597 [Zopfia rhizophila CBS 207.26]|uniref:Uncharacterized protein n=1 Tax=Zopfia rhizophila CBS 207.26 TaxID=1314779 RepID=A0A6A6EW11_9PEZI|nr:hypothetical protein K469DRAFT_10597 [Zopfia rhizophila CBS 207.26]
MPSNTIVIECKQTSSRCVPHRFVYDNSPHPGSVGFLPRSASLSVNVIPQDRQQQIQPGHWDRYRPCFTPHIEYHSRRSAEKGAHGKSWEFPHRAQNISSDFFYSTSTRHRLQKKTKEIRWYNVDPIFRKATTKPYCAAAKNVERTKVPP